MTCDILAFFLIYLIVALDYIDICLAAAWRYFLLTSWWSCDVGMTTIPLQEFRRDIPPRRQVGDQSYPLRLYFNKLKSWYSLDDWIIGPLIAGCLYGKATKIALSLRVPRPDGTADTGDAALARLAVDEVRDPETGAIIQNHIPSRVQFLTSALKAAFGQQDQDLATQALERFFNIWRSRMALAEYSVEFETRLGEAAKPCRSSTQRGRQVLPALQAQQLEHEDGGRYQVADWRRLQQVC